MTHWWYLAPLVVRNGPGWVTHSIDLSDLEAQRWEEFQPDANYRYKREKPDFSVLVNLVLELGSEQTGRRTTGTGVIDVANVRLMEYQGP